jgi:uncharacterized protein involved in outer membrane biogenesis
MLEIRRRRLRTFLLATAILLALFALTGFLAVPYIAKSKIVSLASDELGRSATVGKVQFNPFTLRARISDFALADKDPGRTLLKFDTLDIDVSAASVWRRAPMLDAVKLVRPRIEIARDAGGVYSIQDLIDRAMKPAPAREEETTFAVNNIEVEDGAVLLDDAVHRRRIELSMLHIGIPFLSSFARDAQIRVTPRLQGAIDGTQFALKGASTSPFEDTQQATLQIDFDALQLPRYMEYAPLPSGLKLTEGALTTRLTLAFIMGRGSPRGITLTGTARLDNLAVVRKDASPLAGAKAVQVAIGNLDLLGRSLGVDLVAVEAPRLDLRRLADGSIEAQRLLAVAPADRSPKAGASAAPVREPWSWSVAQARISDGVVRVADEAVSPAFTTTLSAVTAAGAKISSKGAPGTAEIAFDSEDGAHFTATAQVDVEGQAARGGFALTRLPLAKLRPYYARVVAIDVRGGAVDFAADFDAGADGHFILAKGAAVLSQLDLSLRGERDRLWRMVRASADGIAVDVGKRMAGVESIEALQGTVRVLREEDGAMHFQRALLIGDGQEPAPGAAKQSSGAEWRVSVNRLLLDRFAVDFEDRAAEPDVKLRITAAKISAQNLDTAPGAKAKIDVAARIGSRGTVRIDGTATARPVSADARLTAAAIDLVPLKPYLESNTNVIVTSGTVAAKGRVTYAESGPEGPNARYAGDVVVSDFGSLDRPGSQELARWKTLALTGIDVTTAPFNLAMASVALEEFYARLILDANAKLNVLQLLQPRTADVAAPTPQAREAAATPAPAAERKEIPASIGRIELKNGEVEFSDFFVKPNYSVHLKELGGSVSELAARQAGTVEIAAKVDGSAPVDIRGSLNPFAKELALDLTGKATDVELPPLTPYSVKYAGYGIQKGKLTMEVRYKLDNRKLAASNKLVLDQLTFGERVDSPTATKLPVLLAVSLLKDRNGVINLELPIEGTLDDPQFSVWRVVVQIIVNLLTKAMTAPFALLGAIVGGGGEQLAYVEFAPGHAELTPAAIAKLTTLAKALSDRPALKLDAAGRAIPDTDREGLKRAALDRALRLRKQKDVAGSDGTPAPLEALAIDAAEREKYLKAVYKDTDLKGKPRNFIGLAKDVPAAEMEAMLLASYDVSDDGLRELANHRAQAVKEWFATRGGIPAERIFIVAPRLGSEGIKDGATTRVDFAIR